MPSWIRLTWVSSVAQATGRPAYHPSVLLKLYIYGYRCIWNQSPKPSAGEPVDLAGHEV
jgi:hypothetical protein